MNAGGTVKFLLRRDAGTFTCEGIFREGVGGGAFTYAANPAFADELRKRGVTRPTAQQQYEMAKHDVSLALVDDLRAQGYQTPTSDDLVQAGHHGVSGRYVREMGALGYKVGTSARSSTCATTASRRTTCRACWPKASRSSRPRTSSARAIMA